MGDSKLKVLQAIYGEVQNGHDLLASSPADLNDVSMFNDVSIFNRVRLRTGLIDNPPSGTAWEPYVRAFVDGEFYVLTRVFPDISAPRQDMVFTHALFLPLGTFCRSGNLKAAMDLLATHVNKSMALPILELEEEIESAASGAATDRYVALVEALVDTEAVQPPVWVGQKDFLSTVATLWKHFSPEMRRSFEFSLVFVKANIQGRHFIVVVTPEECASYWPAGYRLVRVHHRGGAITPPVGYLLGRPEGDPVRQLERQLETTASDVASLQQLSRIATYLKDAQDGAGGATLDAIRQIGVQVPDPARGVHFKAQLLSRLVDETADSGRSGIWGLRNLPLNPFPEGQKFLECAIQRWASRNIARLTNSVDPSVVRTVSDALLQDSPRENPEWKQFFTEALKRTFIAWEAKNGALVWALWTSNAEIVHLSDPLLPRSNSVEGDLSAAAPAAISSITGHEVLSLCRARRWYLLHASTALRFLSAEDAIMAHLEFDRRENDGSALSVLTSGMNGDVVVRSSVAIQDKRLFEIAAERVGKDPALLREIDLQNGAWRTLLLQTLRAGAELPVSIIFGVFDLLASGSQIELELLLTLSDDLRYSDLCDYEAREAALSRMPRSPQEAFVRATVAGWIARFERDPSSVPAIGGLIRGGVTSTEHVRAWLRTTRATPERVVAFFRRFEDVIHADASLSEWMRIRGTASTVQAASVGALIGERQWHGAADALALAAVHHKDWRAGLPSCWPFLSAFVRFRLVLSGYNNDIAADDWWEAWETVCSRLFPDGVEDHRIWSIADGDCSQISLKTPGSIQWHDALGLLRQGGAKRKITVEGLLHRMRKEFTFDQELQGLEWMWHQRKIT